MAKEYVIICEPVNPNYTTVYFYRDSDKHLCGWSGGIKYAKVYNCPKEADEQVNRLLNICAMLPKMPHEMQKPKVKEKNETSRKTSKVQTSNKHP